MQKRRLSGTQLSLGISLLPRICTLEYVIYDKKLNRKNMNPWPVFHPKFRSRSAQIFPKCQIKKIFYSLYRSLFLEPTNALVPYYSTVAELLRPSIKGIFYLVLKRDVSIYWLEILWWVQNKLLNKMKWPDNCQVQFQLRTF